VPFPLIGLAATLLPEIVRLIAGDRAGSVADSVTQAVRTATGTDDPVQAQARIEQDPQIAAQLRTRLAEIAVEQERMRLEAEEKRRAAELAELEKRLADVQGARSTMLQLSATRDPMRWGAPIVSITVTALFVLALVILSKPEWFEIRIENRELINIVLGALVAAFTAVINFWIGSSQGSREKDSTVRALQQSQAAQTASALTSQAQQHAQVLANQSQTTQAAIAGLRQAVGTAAIAGAAAAGSAPSAAAPAAKRRAFEAAIELVLDKEGGFTNNPRDRGGPTNFGITAKTYAAFHGRDPATVTEQEIRELTREQAIEIYRTNYWNAGRCDSLPPGIDLSVFDFGVNAGMRTSVGLLQAIAGVEQDGSIGPITLAAVGACDPPTIIRQFSDRRLDYYRSMPDFDAFGRGWTARVMAIRDASLRMVADTVPAGR
jgi:lysozyme family protein